MQYLIDHARLQVAICAGDTHQRRVNSLTSGSQLRRRATRVPGGIHRALLSHLKRGDTVYTFRLLDTLVTFLVVANMQYLTTSLHGIRPRRT